MNDRLELITSYFGGSNYAAQLASSADLAVITSFPGAVIVTSVNALTGLASDSDRIDLLALGYVEQSPYQILDREYKFVLQSQSAQYLGASLSEIELGSQAAHGSYYYLTFEDASRVTVTVLLWLLREQSPAVRDTTLNAIRATANAQQQFAHTFNLFVSAEKPELNRQRTLYLLTLAGEWQQPPTIASMLANPKTQTTAISASLGQMLVNIQDTWIAVVELIPSSTVGQPLELSTVWWLVRTYGLGTERLLQHEKDVVFVAGEGFNRLTLDTTPKRSYEANRLNAQATFGFGYTVEPIAPPAPALQNVTFSVTAEAPTTPTVLPVVGVIITPVIPPINSVDKITWDAPTYHRPIPIPILTPVTPLVVTVALAPNSPSFGQLGQTDTNFSVLDGDQRTGLGIYQPQHYFSTGMVVRFSIDNPIPNDLPISVSILDSLINLTHFQGTQLNLQSSGGLNITQLNLGNIVIPANLNYVDITFSSGRNSSDYKQVNYNPVLVASSSDPNVTVINPNTTLPFKNNRRLIIKVSQSQSPPNYLTQISYGKFVPVGYASNVDYPQMPCIYTYDLNTFAIQGIANYYPDIIELFNSQFPPQQKPFKQPDFDLYSYTNPDTSPNRYEQNLYYEVIIQHLIDRANALGKRYIYLVSNATFGIYDALYRPNPPSFLVNAQSIYDNSSSINNRFNASIEICGSQGYTSGEKPFTPQILEPYALPNSDHKGYMTDVRPMFKYLKSDLEAKFSHVFSQFCIKIDTQQSIDQIKLIPSFVPPYLLNDPKTTVTPNTQIII